MAEGDIGAAAIDTLIFESGAQATYCKIIHVAGDIYAIVYRGVDSDGFVCTVSINKAGTIHAIGVIDSLEFETSSCDEPEIFEVAPNVFGIAYRGPDDDGWLKTFPINSFGDIGAIIDSYEFDAGTCYAPSVIHVGGTTFAISYMGVDSDGWLCTVDISTAGGIGAVIDTLEYDAAQGGINKIIHVSGDVYAIAYQGPDMDGWVCTMTIDINGNIGAAVIDTLEWDIASGQPYGFEHISGDIYAVAYIGASGKGFCTFTIDADGNIGAAVIDAHSLASMANGPQGTIPVSGDYYAFVWKGSEAYANGYVGTVAIDSAGAIAADAQDYLAFFTGGVDLGVFTRGDIVHIDGHIYAIAYYGAGAIAKGILITLNLETIKTFTIPGYIWIEGTKIHYTDDRGVERAQEGAAV